MSVRTLRASGPTAFAVLVVALALGPRYLSANGVTIGVTVLTYAGMAQAWNVVGGFGGQFSLGHSVFVGTGAYGAAVLFLHTGLPLALVLPIAGLLSAAIAVLMGLVLFRLRGVYFSIGSLAVSLAAVAWMVNWNYTGANQGLNIPFTAIPGENTLYELALGGAALATLLAWAASRTNWGLRVQAVRDDEQAAVLAGIASGRLKLATLAASAFCTAIVGVVLALQQISINPVTMFGLTWTINMVVMTVVGGIGTVPGPLIGAVVIYYGIEQQFQSHAQVSTLITGVLVLLVIRFFPGGIWEAMRRGGGWLGAAVRASLRLRPKVDAS